MEESTIYLKRYAYPRQWINDPPKSDLGICVVIPSFAEPDLGKTIQSLHQNHPLPVAVEVLVIINDAISSEGEVKNLNRASLATLAKINAEIGHPNLQIRTIHVADIPDRDHGVGFARKIGMDEAVRRFEAAGKTKGAIVCLDADCEVSCNYLLSIHEHFERHPKDVGASIYFEHPLKGPAEQTQAIAGYELHLRYLVHAQRYSGFQQASQTVGSSMAVRSDTYQKVGGMNRRKAGEDFHFLQKVIKAGTFGEIKQAVVFPSARISERVPFGTGRAMGKQKDGGYPGVETYNSLSFEALKSFVASIPAMYTNRGLTGLNLAPCIIEFLESIQFDKKLNAIRHSTASQETFNRRFLQYFDGFMVMKFLHFARDRYFSNVPVLSASNWLLTVGFGNKEPAPDVFNALELLRKIDRDSS